MAQPATEERKQEITERTFATAISNTNGVYEASGNAVLIDCNRGVIALGGDVLDALGTVRSHRDLYGFMLPTDAFRLEQFILRRAPFSKVPAIELALCGASRFKCAVASRGSMFGKDTVVVEFFEDERARLMADRLALKYLSVADRPGDTGDVLAEAERLMALFAASHPGEAEKLRSYVASVIRRSLAPVLIESIIAPGKSRAAAIDVKDLASSAAKYIKTAIPGASVTTSFTSGAGRGRTVSPGISAEHLWHLVTCALATALGMSSNHGASLSLTQSESAIAISIRAKVGVADELPPTLRLGEVREIMPPSAMRLYLCELICEEYGIASVAAFEGGEMELCFEIEPRGESDGFHRAEKEERIARFREIIASAVIIADEA